MNHRLAHSALVQRASERAPSLALHLKAHGPLVMPAKRSHSAGHHLAQAIVGQQLSGAAADTIWGRIEALAARSSLEVLDLLRACSAQELRACGVSSNKARALKTLVEHIDGGALDDNALTAMNHSTRVAELTKIWGIGKWTCDMLSIFHFGEVDVWPCTDGSVRSGLAKILGWRKISDERVEAFGEPFSPWRSYLALHVWHWLDSR